jgi:hypothetical protein
MSHKNVRTLEFIWKSRKILRIIKNRPFFTASTAVWPSTMFFCDIKLYLILIKQKIFKKIAFVVKMDKMVSFRPIRELLSIISKHKNYWVFIHLIRKYEPTNSKISTAAECHTHYITQWKAFMVLKAVKQKRKFFCCIPKYRLLVAEIHNR